MNIDKLKAFAAPYYKNKDSMHNMWHIELVHKWVDKIISLGNYEVNYENLITALYFHGFIYSNENEIKEWLKKQNISDEEIEVIITISWESQRFEIPKTLEGKILHDAHVLEGGKTYFIVKSLITGSGRDQTLTKTLDYMNQNIEKNHCYLPETATFCDETNAYAKDFIKELEKGIL